MRAGYFRAFVNKQDLIKLSSSFIVTYKHISSKLSNTQQLAAYRHSLHLHISIHARPFNQQTCREYLDAIFIIGVVAEKGITSNLSKVGEDISVTNTIDGVNFPESQHSLHSHETLLYDHPVKAKQKRLHML